MNQPNFQTMNQKELRDYFLSHREDRDAFYAYIDKLYAEGNWIEMSPLKSLEDLENYPEFVDRATQYNTIMTDGSNKIQIGDMGEDFNASNSIWNLDEISGKVTRTISELSPSPEPTQLGIKEILGQLQEAINTDNNLSEQDKTTALQQVQLLAEASKDPKNGAKKNIAKNAITMLKGILSSLPTATKLVETCQQLVPTIATIFGF